jgi:hypothetical protein
MIIHYRHFLLGKVSFGFETWKYLQEICRDICPFVFELYGFWSKRAYFPEVGKNIISPYSPKLITSTNRIEHLNMDRELLNFLVSLVSISFEIQKYLGYQ